MSEDESDDLVSEHDVKPVLSSWKRFLHEIGQQEPFHLRVVIVATGVLCAMIMIWCVFNKSFSGLGLTLLMMIGTLRVSDSEHDPYN